MIRIVWFRIVLTVNTCSCSMHGNLHYHVRSPMVYVKQAMASLLLALVAIIFTPINVTISIVILILY